MVTRAMPTIRANDLAIHYDLAGPEGAPVVMLSNSLGTRLEMWDPQMAALTRHHRVLRHDSRGHGRTDAPAGPYTVEQLAEDALGLLDALGLERVHFCGLSMGGMVGQVLGARHGERLSSLTLCATTCRMPAPEMWDERIRLTAAEGMAAVVDAVTERWFTATFRKRAPEAVEPIREMILATSPVGYGACCAAIRDMDICEAAASIRAPTLVVAGADDPATTPDVMQALADRIEGARFVEIADAAHLLNIQQADEFNRLLLDFLAANG
jgi:3-oxoadipate enol-lactonase